MKLQEFEKCLSSFAQSLEKQVRRFEDLESRFDIILARLEVQEEKTATLALDFQEWQLAKMPFAERV